MTPDQLRELRARAERLAEAKDSYVAVMLQPSEVIALVDEIERLRANRDHSCACSANDGGAPLVKHDKDCPIRVNARKRIAPEVAMERLAAALHSGDENEELRQRLAAMTAARNELAEIAHEMAGCFDDPGSRELDYARIAALSNVGADHDD